jgi:hypothetical protein
MPSLRGASFRQPDARQSARHRRYLIPLAAIATCVPLAASASAQSAAEPALSAGSSASSASEERPRVILLVRTENDDGVMNRVRAELRSSAWRIVELRVDDRLARAPLGQLAAEQAVRAAIRFDPAEARIELWIFRATGSVEETLGDRSDRDDDAVLALRITEALRARGLNLGPEPLPRDSRESEKVEANEGATMAKPAQTSAAAAQKKNEPPATADKPEEARARQVRPFRNELWLELAPALSGSPGGLGPAVAGFASVRFELTPRWSGSLLGLVPLVAQRLTGPEGTANVSIYFVGTAADVAWFRTPRWELSTGAGVGWAQSEMRGTASAGYMGGSDSVTAITPLARTTARLRLIGRWWLTIGGLGGVAVPEVSVKFGDRVAGRWGRPLLVATFGLQLLAARWPAPSSDADLR